jgi:hypothetical protein
MVDKIDFKKFKYYIIAIDVLRKNSPYLSSRISKLSSSSTVEYYFPRVRFPYVREIFIIDRKKKDEKLFSNVFIDVSHFLKERVLITYGELTKYSIDKWLKIKEQNSLSDFFYDLRDRLLAYYKSMQVIDKDNESIFTDYITFSGMPVPPFIIYAEPLSDLSFNINNKKELKNKIDIINKKFKSHKDYWCKADNYILMNFLTARFPWDSLIFINTDKFIKEANNFYFPRFLELLINQIVSHHWLNYKKSELNQVKISKFDIINIKLNDKLKNLSNIHGTIQTDLRNIISFNAHISNDLNSIRLNNSDFTEIFRSYNRWEPYGEKYFPGSTIIERLEEKMTNQIESIETLQRQLRSKAHILSNFSRDILNTKIAEINLKLQKAVIFLSVILLAVSIILMTIPFID